MNTLVYKYRTISVGHFRELQADIDALKKKVLLASLVEKLKLFSLQNVEVRLSTLSRNLEVLLN